MNRFEILKALKEKGIKFSMKMKNTELLALLDVKEKPIVQNKALEMPKIDDRFVLVEFIKPSTPYRKGDVVRLEKRKYEFLKKNNVLKIL